MTVSSLDVVPGDVRRRLLVNYVKALDVCKDIQYGVVHPDDAEYFRVLSEEVDRLLM
jgi:hypothetical protein